MRKTSKAIPYFLFGMAAYILATIVYIWLTPNNDVPLSYRGTAIDPVVFMSESQLAASTFYSDLRDVLFFVSFPWEWAIYFILLSSGIASNWEQRLEDSRVPRFLHLPVYAFLLSGLSFLIFLPLRFTGYLFARHYGISTQPWMGWVRDKLLDFGLNTCLMIIVSAFVFWLIRRGGRWWLTCWLCSIPFLVFMMFIQPIVIDPLYHQFNRLSDSELEQQILDMAHKAEIPADRVYEVNMSQKTNSLNAYVNGIGSSLRIVLYDTTLSKLSHQEIMLIMAHEMGHYTMHHLEWSLLGAMASSFFLLWLGSRILQWLVRTWGKLWGIRHMHQLTVLPLIMLLLSLFSFASLPVSNAISRQAEHAADQYAMKLIGNADGVLEMYQKLSMSSLRAVNPPPVVKWFRSTHPSIMERMIESEQTARTDP